jgi:hypothetical protein
MREGRRFVGDGERVVGVPAPMHQFSEKIHRIKDIKIWEMNWFLEVGFVPFPNAISRFMNQRSYTAKCGTGPFVREHPIFN